MNSKDNISRVTVHILDDEYIVKGNAEKRHIENVASYVDTRMKQLSLRNPQLSPKKIAVLTALNIAEELFQIKGDYDSLTKMLDENK